jgi:hypothetical protein
VNKEDPVQPKSAEGKDIFLRTSGAPHPSKLCATTQCGSYGAALRLAPLHNMAFAIVQVLGPWSQMGRHRRDDGRRVIDSKLLRGLRLARPWKLRPMLAIGSRSADSGAIVWKLANITAPLRSSPEVFRGRQLERAYRSFLSLCDNIK